MEYILEMKNMTKKYGDFYANKEISFSLRRGEVHAVIGENGAGKTTLMRMLYGMEQPTSGDIFIKGERSHLQRPSDAIQRGIGMVHQHFMLFPHLTVTENVVIGHEPRKLNFFNRKEAAQKVEKLSAQYRIPVRPLEKVINCSIGEQQRIEIIKVLYQGADIIVLDEPTAVLTPLEVKELIKTIRFLASEGKSIIIITHKLQEVMEAADRVTVLRNGEVTGSMSIADAAPEKLAELMVGRKLRDIKERESMNGAPYMQVKDVTMVDSKAAKPIVDRVSFHVSTGEIVGIAGVSGNGQSELIQAIAGLASVESGSIIMEGKDVTKLSAQKHRELGLAHIPEDRYQWGAAKSATVEENAFMGNHRQPLFSKFGWLQKKVMQSELNKWIAKYSIKTNSIKEEVANLSGGNLQKLIVAREMGHDKPFLIAAEPTRGVDIGAMEMIHDAIVQKRNEGGSILLVSSELTEILKLSDRVLVMYEGKIVGDLDRASATEEKISLLMAGGSVKDDVSSLS